MTKKQSLLYSFIIFSSCSALSKKSWSESAQQTYDTVTTWMGKTRATTFSHSYDIVPASTITINNNQGDIVVATWKQNSIALEINALEPAQEKTPTEQYYTFSQQKNVCTLTSMVSFKTNYKLMVPEQSSLVLKTDQGSITVKDVLGTLEAETRSGSIKVENGHNTLNLRAPQGSLVLEQTVLEPRESIFLEARDDVTLKLAPTINAHIDAKTLSGRVTSTMGITLDPITVKLNSATWKRMKQEVQGSIGSGGSPITIDVLKGNITIEEL